MEAATEGPFVQRVLLHDDIIRLFIEGAVRPRKPPTQVRFLADVDTLRVTLPNRVTSDPPHPTGYVSAAPGIYRAKIGGGGAVCVVVGDGDPESVDLGVKPGEFSFLCPYAAGETVLATREVGHNKAWTVMAKQSRLWVAEDWRAWRDTCDGGDTGDDHECAPNCDQTYVSYRTTPREGYRPRPDRQRITYLDASSPVDDPRLEGPWLSAEDMPRSFARLWLEVSSVRLERLGDASAKDMRAAGATCSLDDWSPHCGSPSSTAVPCDSLRQRFRDLMNKTIGSHGSAVPRTIAQVPGHPPAWPLDLVSTQWVWTVECRSLRVGEGD